jgi:4-hydroxybenzoate polyprenyltransferase
VAEPQKTQSASQNTTQNNAATPRYVVTQGAHGPQVVLAGQPHYSKLRATLRLMRLDRPIGIYLLLWPTMAALMLASAGAPGWHLVLVFSLGVLLTRSAGCVINDYADRWLDPQVSRTRQRPLASGELSGRFALLIFAVLMLLALMLVLSTNLTTVLWAFGAAVLAAGYPYAKRWIYTPQLVLGVAFSFGIPMAFTASEVQVNAVCGLLFCFNVLWTFGYDTLYAMVDRDEDVSAGAKSSAILFGELDLIAIACCYGIALLAWSLMGQKANLGWPFWLLTGLMAVQMAGQLWHAQTRTREACFSAFLSNQWLGLTLFAAVATGLHFR